MLQWREEGKSYSAIGKLIGATKDRVKKFFKRIREKSELEQILGPPIVISRRIITARIGRQIQYYLSKHPKHAIPDIKKYISDQNPHAARIPAESTILAWLKENGYSKDTLKKKGWLKAKNVQPRLNFAQLFHDRPKSFCWRILWSDETCVWASPQNKMVKFWTRSGSRNHEELPYNEQVHSGGFKVMFWGASLDMGGALLFLFLMVQSRQPTIKESCVRLWYHI